MNGQEIAKIILSQIKAMSPMALMSWGATQFISFTGNNQIAVPEALQDDAKGFLGGLMFKVNGLKHKGKVVIALHARDTYTIFTVKVRGDTVKFDNVRSDVYVDELISTLDNIIEGREYPR